MKIEQGERNRWPEYCLNDVKEDLVSHSHDWSEQYEIFSAYDDNIFPCFHEFDMFSMENFKVYSKSWTLQRMSCMTSHIRKAGKVDLGDRVTLIGKFACKPELT